jgi:hypothetical protein
VSTVDVAYQSNLQSLQGSRGSLGSHFSLLNFHQRHALYRPVIRTEDGRDPIHGKIPSRVDPECAALRTHCQMTKYYLSSKHLSERIYLLSTSKGQSQHLTVFPDALSPEISITREPPKPCNSASSSGMPLASSEFWMLSAFWCASK